MAKTYAVTYRGPSDPRDRTSRLTVVVRDATHTFPKGVRVSGLPAVVVKRLKQPDLAGHQFTHHTSSEGTPDV